MDVEGLGTPCWGHWGGGGDGSRDGGPYWGPGWGSKRVVSLMWIHREGEAVSPRGKGEAGFPKGKNRVSGGELGVPSQTTGDVGSLQSTDGDPCWRTGWRSGQSGEVGLDRQVSLGKEWGHGGDLGESLLESLERWGVLSEGMGLVGVPGELWGAGCSSGGLYPPQFAEQLGDAGEAPRRPLVITVLEHQLHHLGVPRAHRLLQHWGHGVPSARGHLQPWMVSPGPCGAPVPVHPLAFSRPTLALCRSSTRTDSRWPRDTASSRGVRPRGSVSSTSCWKGAGVTAPSPCHPSVSAMSPVLPRPAAPSPLFSQCCYLDPRAPSRFQACGATVPYYPSVTSPSSATSSSSAPNPVSLSQSQSPHHSQSSSSIPIPTNAPSTVPASSPCSQSSQLPSTSLCPQRLQCSQFSQSPVLPFPL